MLLFVVCVVVFYVFVCDFNLWFDCYLYVMCVLVDWFVCYCLLDVFGVVGCKLFVWYLFDLYGVVDWYDFDVVSLCVWFVLLLGVVFE